MARDTKDYDHLFKLLIIGDSGKINFFKVINNLYLYLKKQKKWL